MFGTCCGFTWQTGQHHAAVCSLPANSQWDGGENKRKEKQPNNQKTEKKKKVEIMGWDKNYLLEKKGKRKKGKQQKQ